MKTPHPLGKIEKPRRSRTSLSCLSTVSSAETDCRAYRTPRAQFDQCRGPHGARRMSDRAPRPGMAVCGTLAQRPTRHPATALIAQLHTSGAHMLCSHDKHLVIMTLRR